MPKSLDRKWINLMNVLGWKGQVVWQDMNDMVVAENIPQVEQWARDHLKFVAKQHPQEAAAFRQFYLPTKSISDSKSYRYIRKDRAECALAALYAKELADG